MPPFAELIKDGLDVRDLELAELETVGTSYGVTQVMQVNAWVKDDNEIADSLSLVTTLSRTQA